MANKFKYAEMSEPELKKALEANSDLEPVKVDAVNRITNTLHMVSSNIRGATHIRDLSTGEDFPVHHDYI